MTGGHGQNVADEIRAPSERYRPATWSSRGQAAQSVGDESGHGLENRGRVARVSNS